MKNSIIILTLGLTFILSSCSKDFLDVNTDPSALTDADPKLILPAAIVKNAYNNGAELSIFSSIFTNYVRGIDRQAMSYTNYILNAGDFDNIWKFSFFTSALKSSYDLKESAKKRSRPHHQACGNILLALGIIQASDVWGDIPYSEAFLGLEKVNPKFDKQESVYAAADALLDEAITLLNAPNGGSPIEASADLLYGGSTAKWIKLAYALKARHYLHLTKVKGNSYYQKALDASNKALSSSADNAIVSFIAGGAYNAAPWNQFNTNRGDIVVHEEFIAKLDANNDPRKAFMVDQDELVGSYYGNDNSEVCIMSYDEIKFIQAEAKKALGQSASADLKMAVNANITRITGTSDDAFATTVSADESMNNIMLQKHIAMFTTLEGWNDWRRTGMPALKPNTGTQIPRSFFYSAAEQQANSNCPSNTTIFRRIWWDQ
ncbi:MAG: SusD/RagB family nutrient-binding outer membrane lipoprotein [Chitinophagales bacterium]|jgi:hypothetical protein|nr:SusD/RagB family nutrient-binding outer membrane lipoprotein [Sphingobacteriales bacterium]